MYFSGTGWPQDMVRWMGTSGSRQVFSFHGLEVVLTSVGISGIELLGGHGAYRGGAPSGNFADKDGIFTGLAGGAEAASAPTRPGNGCRNSSDSSNIWNSILSDFIASGEDQKPESYYPGSRHHQDTPGRMPLDVYDECSACDSNYSRWIYLLPHLQEVSTRMMRSIHAHEPPSFARLPLNQQPGGVYQQLSRLTITKKTVVDVSVATLSRLGSHHPLVVLDLVVFGT